MRLGLLLATASLLALSQAAPALAAASEELTDCDVLAAHPDDPARAAAGVRREESDMGIDPLGMEIVPIDVTNERTNEDACLVRLSQVVPPGGAVTILADRGFGFRLPRQAGLRLQAFR